MKTFALFLLMSVPVFAQDAVVYPAEEAAQHVGKEITVRGVVASARIVKSSGHLFLSLGEAYPNQVCTVFIGKDSIAAVGLDESVSGKTIEATGKVKMMRDKPSVDVSSKDKIKVLDAAGAPAAATTPATPAPAAEKKTPTPAAPAPAADAPAAQAASGSFSSAVAGTPLTVTVPVPAEFQAAAGGATAMATILLPEGFDPAKPNFVFVVPSGNDGAPRITGFDPVAKKGWIVLSGGTPAKPTAFTAAWNQAVASAALGAVKSAWPAAESWPVAVGGQSGGAKGACQLAVALAKAGRPVKGLFLSGLSDDVLTKAYRDQKPDAAFLAVPIFLSAASGDHVATPALVEKAAESMKAGGFTGVQVLTREGKFGVDAGHVALALEAFAK